jgi:hypothetical protein
MAKPLEKSRVNSATLFEKMFLLKLRYRFDRDASEHSTVAEGLNRTSVCVDRLREQGSLLRSNSSCKVVELTRRADSVAG